MKRQSKIALLGLTTLVALGGVLWMRELASWRPVKLGEVNRGYALGFLSGDNRTTLLITDDMLYSAKLDLSSGEESDWPESEHPNIEFSKNPPEWAAVSESKGKQGELRIREIQSGQLKRVFHWPVSEKNSYPEVLPQPDGSKVRLVDSPFFFEWSVESGKLLRKVALQNPLPYRFNVPIRFAVSPDGHQLFGCTKGGGRTWETKTGKVVHSWTTQSALFPLGFSPDARLVIYSDFSSRRIRTYRLVDTSTGIMTRETHDEILNSFSADGSETIFPQANNCEVRDSFTDRVTRQLPRPWLQDGNIVRVTRDFIYTRNAKSFVGAPAKNSTLGGRRSETNVSHHEFGCC